MFFILGGPIGKIMKHKIFDRRPISARNNQFSKRFSTFLAAQGVSPNSISVASLGFSMSAGLCLFLTSTDFSTRWLWGLAALFILLRLLANMFDGMVAVELETTSTVGDIFNEVPDRLSDVIIFISAGFAAGSSPDLGYVTAILSLFVAYLRTLGNFMGVNQLFIGPMAKSHRMFALIAICFYNALMPDILWIPSLLTWGLSVIIFGSVITVIRRLQRVITVVSA